MKIILNRTFLLITGIIIIISANCCSSKQAKVESEPENIDVQKQDTLPNNFYCTFDLLGLEASGSIDHFFDIILGSEYFSLDSLTEAPVIKKDGNGNISIFRVLRFCDIPCGMNIHTRGNQIIEINFLTSQRDLTTIKAFNSVLKKYYGKPFSSETQDIKDGFGRYTWFADTTRVVSRSLNHGAEGWTVSFSR